MIRIKVSGIRSPGEAVAVARAGADAIGVSVAFDKQIRHGVAVEVARTIFRAIELASIAHIPSTRRVAVVHESDSSKLIDFLTTCPEVEEIEMHADLDATNYGVFRDYWVRERKGVSLIAALDLTQLMTSRSRALSTPLLHDARAVVINLGKQTCVSPVEEFCRQVREELRLPIIIASDGIASR